MLRGQNTSRTTFIARSVGSLMSYFARDLDTLKLEDVGNLGWNPICFITPVGFRYYFPAFARGQNESHLGSPVTRGRGVASGYSQPAMRPPSAFRLAVGGTSSSVYRPPTSNNRIWRAKAWGFCQGWLS